LRLNEIYLPLIKKNPYMSVKFCISPLVENMACQSITLFFKRIIYRMKKKNLNTIIYSENKDFNFFNLKNKVKKYISFSFIRNSFFFK
jgi:hypothetical protein